MGKHLLFTSCLDPDDGRVVWGAVKDEGGNGMSFVAGLIVGAFIGAAIVMFFVVVAEERDDG